MEQADAEFADAQAAVTDRTPLAEASEMFNSAVVALEMAWLNLFADAGCLTDEQQLDAAAAVGAYTLALQEDLAATGYDAGTVDGISGPMTSCRRWRTCRRRTGRRSPVPSTRRPPPALQAELLALGGVEAQDSLDPTAAIQQTLKLLGFRDRGGQPSAGSTMPGR